MVEIIENPTDEIGLFSIGMDVEDLDATLKELKSKGVKVTMETTKTTVGTMAFIEDPNGVKIALIPHK